MPLAPLHNPANLAGIRAARRLFPDVPHVAVFDTAFHQTLPPPPTPTRSTRDLARASTGSAATASTARRTRSSAEAAADFLGRPLGDVNQIVLHLGNGASATAVDGGRSVETSMGLTPLEGLVMGTRSGRPRPGDPRPPAPRSSAGRSTRSTLLNRESGCKGLVRRQRLPRASSRRQAAGDEAAQARLRRLLPPAPQVRRRLLRRARRPSTPSSSPPASARTPPSVRAAALAGLDAARHRASTRDRNEAGGAGAAGHLHRRLRRRGARRPHERGAGDRPPGARGRATRRARWKFTRTRYEQGGRQRASRDDDVRAARARGSRHPDAASRAARHDEIVSR